MKKLLRSILFAVVLFMSAGFFSSCVKNTIEEIHYTVGNVRTSVNLRAAPNLSSEILTQIPRGEEVFPLEDKSYDSDWVLVRTVSGREGYIHDDYIMREKKLVPASRDEILDFYNQKCSVAFSFVKETKAKYDSDSLTNFFHIVIMVMSIVLAIWLYFTRVRWWHYLFLIILSGIITAGICLCDLTGAGGSYTLFVRIIMAILLVVVFPMSICYSMMFVLLDCVKDIDEPELLVRGHIFLSVLLAVFCYVAIMFFPKIADKSFLIFGGVQALFFFVFMIASVFKHYFMSFIKYFIVFWICFPPIFLSLGFVALQLISLVFVCLVFVSPFMGGTSSSQSSTYTLRDQAGQTIDTIDSSGYSTSGNGNHYSKNPDGTYRKD